MIAAAVKLVPKKTSKLKAVAPKSAGISKPKILVSGKPGVGKTWVSLDFPSVYYIDTEGGANLPHYTDKLEKAGGVYLGHEQGSLSFENVIDQINALRTEKHNFKTLVIDSISKLFYEEISKEAERLGDKDAFGASKKPAVNYMRRLVSKISDLDMNVILIAHSMTEWGIVNGQRSEIGTTFDAWNKLEFELHLWIEIMKAGANRIARVRKSRLQNFPDGETMPWSYKEFADRYGKEIIEKPAEPVVLASADQVTELKELLETIKLPDGQVEKWLAAKNVEKIEELSAETASGFIKHLNSLLPKKKEDVI